MTATGEAAQIIDALFSRCQTLAVGSPVMTVAYPEVAFTPPPSGKYLQVDFFANKPAWEGLASGKMAQGLLQITIIWPRGVGMIAPAQIIDGVVSHFAKGTTLYEGSVKVSVNQEPWDATAITEDTQLRIPITIPWVAVAV